MAIKIKSLDAIAKNYTEQNFIYKDLTLDIIQTKLFEPGFKIPTPGSDIQASFDLEAIKNSLQNLFNTKPGERFLYPEYGLDLTTYLFSPITEANGRMIGSVIFNTINNWEPRISVKNVNVITDPDNNQYNINIFISVPVLNINTTVESVLDVKRQSFLILPTSQTR
jgi:phage baseplate assembly protein W